MEDKICDFRKLLVNHPDTDECARFFESLDLSNGWKMSIQASKVHHADPKETLNNIYDYTTMELALSVDGIWVDMNNNETIKNFDRYKDLIPFCSVDKHTIGSYVPIGIILDLSEFEDWEEMNIETMINKYSEPKINIKF